MKGTTAAMIFLGICIALAVLLMLKVIGPTTTGWAFAVALVALGLPSRSFRRK